MQNSQVIYNPYNIFSTYYSVSQRIFWCFRDDKKLVYSHSVPNMTPDDTAKTLPNR